MTYSPIERVIISTVSVDGYGKNLDISDKESGKLIFTLRSVNSIKCSPDGNILISNSDEGVKIYEVKTGKLIRSLDKEVRNAGYTPDGRYIVYLLWNNNIQIWDKKKENIIHLLEEPKGWTNPVGYSCYTPDGKYIIASSSFYIVLWEIKNGTLIYIIDNTEGASVDLSSDSKYLTIKFRNKSKKILDIEKKSLSIS